MGKHHSAASQPRHVPRLILTAALIVCGILSLVGLVRTWPSSDPINVAPEFSQTFTFNLKQVAGTVELVEEGSCQSPSAQQVFDSGPVDSLEAGEQGCQRAIIRIDEGPDAGRHTLLISSGMPGDPEYHEGAKVLLTSSDGRYAFSDYDRGTALLIWGVVIALAVIAFAAWRGLRALLGLAITLSMVVIYLLPALLRGGNGISLAVIGGASVLYLVLFLVHGVNWKTASALAGTLIALGLAAGLANWMIHSANLRGLGSEDNLKILLYLPDVSVRGLMLCGFIIGALGVLNDVTIAQASTVNELAALNPASSPWRLFLGAMKVGRDHIASMIYTLVLSYTGAALPLLLLIELSERSFWHILSSDIVATELLRSGIGALALTLAVPLTTLIAAVTVPAHGSASQLLSTGEHQAHSAHQSSAE
ncbi:YibE/F family protein [Corynebacterium sp. 3HC-13]|uniref:YibE/F family protein n=1 Tax=Corynebacterium poyangense TaxID=2684405 RepID=UPI001CCDC7BF|nr:YibE/F family protein [Corynebacterium poyangense]MBZ8176587.1 YibE/F family protein [Corynebacterium poyangense]